MPEYTKLAKERDIYGELGWVNNFNVSFSKNNHKLYPTYREFFDVPVNYQKQFNNTQLSNQEFFRQNAPPGSVAKQTGGTGRFSPSQSTLGMKSSFMGSRHNRSTTVDMNNSISASNFVGSKHATPFFLDRDNSNRHRVLDEVRNTVGQSSEIPFLRTQLDPMKLSRQNNAYGLGRYLSNNSSS